MHDIFFFLACVSQICVFVFFFCLWLQLNVKMKIPVTRIYELICISAPTLYPYSVFLPVGTAEPLVLCALPARPVLPSGGLPSARTPFLPQRFLPPY